MMKRFLTLSLTFTFTASCVTTPKESIENLAGEGSCEKAYQELGEYMKGSDLTGTASRGVKTVSSYSVAAAGYAADAVVVTVGLAGIFIISCGPMIAANALAAKGGAPFVGNCIPLSVVNEEGNYESLGNKALDNTSDWRRNKATEVSQAIRSVARCFAQGGGSKNLMLAHSQLTSFRQVPFYPEVSSGEKDRVNSAITKVEGELQTVNPSYVVELKRQRQEVQQQLENQAQKLTAKINEKKIPAENWLQEREGVQWHYQRVSVPKQDVARQLCQRFGKAAQLPREAQIDKAAKQGLWENLQTAKGDGLIWLDDSGQLYDLKEKELVEQRGKRSVYLLCAG